MTFNSTGALETVVAYINGVQKQYYAKSYEELTELGLSGRVKLYDWTLEIVGALICIAIVLIFNFGAYVNKRKVDKWLTAVTPVLEENFAQVGVQKGKLYIKDSAQLYTSYATGRVNIKGLTSSFSLINRLNYLYYLLELIMSSFFESVPGPEDTVEIEANLFDAEKWGKYIFAIVNKEGMNKSRSENYYLSLTKTTESAKLPTEFVFMSESAELNEGLVTDDLKVALIKAAPILKFLAVTDLPADHPEKEIDFLTHPKLVLKLRLDTSAKSLAATKELLTQFIALADRVCKFQLKQEQQKKINNVRVNELNKIKKVIQEQQLEELKEKKLEAEKAARRTSKLSPEEQDKLDRKQREKRERRARNKQTKRM